MDGVERLIAVEDIKRLKAKYFRCVDTRDWEGYRSVFADDVVFDITQDMPDGGYVVGGDAAADIARNSLTTDIVSVHHGHCRKSRFSRRQPPRASGRWKTGCRGGPTASFRARRCTAWAITSKPMKRLRAAGVRIGVQ